MEKMKGREAKSKDGKTGEGKNYCMKNCHVGDDTK